jgi:hypothetical protein
MTESAPRPDTSDMPAVHNVFRSSLATGPTLVASAAGDEERRALIANYYLNLIAFLEAHHDGEEELVFPLLLERAPDQRALVEKAKSQHDDVVTLMGAAKDSLGSWDEVGDAGASEVERSLRALDDLLTPHLDQEEAEIVPLAADHLSCEEWGALPGHAMRTFTGDKVWLILGLVRENFTQRQRDLMLEGMPPPVRQMWETTGEASFNDLMAQVRQTP